MTSLVSIFTVIVMLFTSVGGMTAGTATPASFDAKISVNTGMLSSMIPAAPTEAPAQEAAGETPAEEAASETAAQTPVQSDLPTAISDLLNALTIKGVADGEYTELDLYAGEDLLLSIGTRNVENGATLASSLLGKNVLFVPTEVIQQTMQQLQASMAQSVSGVNATELSGILESMDKEQACKDCAEFAAKLAAAFEEKKGETETGEFTADEMTFTARTPVNMTYTEMTELLIVNVKELLAKESLKPLVDAVSQGKDIGAELDQSLEKLKEMPEEQQYDLAIAIYSDEQGSSYNVIDASRKGSEDGTVKAENMHIGAGTVEGQTKVLVTSEQFRFELALSGAEGETRTIRVSLSGQGIVAAVAADVAADGSLDVTVDAQIQGMPVRVHTVTAKEGERMNYQAEIFLLTTAMPFATVTGSAGPGGERVSVYEGEDILTIPVEKLADTEDPTTSTQVSMSLMANLLKAVTVLTKNLPEGTANWVNAQVMQAMSPGGATTQTQEAPAANE